MGVDKTMRQAKTQAEDGTNTVMYLMKLLLWLVKISASVMKKMARPDENLSNKL